MVELQYLIFTVIILALIFDFINGFHDTANAIATSVNTRALYPNHAIMLAAGFNFVGAMFSTGVAKTIGGGIVSSPSLIDEKVITAEQKEEYLYKKYICIFDKNRYKLALAYEIFLG